MPKSTVETMAEAVSGMVEAGFHASLERNDKHRDETLVFERWHWTLTRGDTECFELEALRYPNGAESFFLQLVRFHGMRTFSFPLDSWKLWPDRIEFRYYTHPETGQGLTFILALER